mgnify:FL=1
MKKTIFSLIAILILSVSIISSNTYETKSNEYYSTHEYDDFIFINNTRVGVNTYGGKHEAWVDGVNLGNYNSTDEAFVAGLIYYYNTTSDSDKKITAARILKYGFGYDISQLASSSTTTNSESTVTESSETVTAESDASASSESSTNSSSSSSSTSNNTTSEATKVDNEATTSDDNTSDAANEENSEEVEEWTEIARVEPTCTSEGSVTYQSSLSGETKEEILDKIDHTAGEQQTIIEAGLFSTGTAIVRCTVCDEVLEEITLPATFPTWGFIVIGIVAVAIVITVIIITGLKKKHN